jgi:hypothetical protein
MTHVHRRQERRSSTSYEDPSIQLSNDRPTRNASYCYLLCIILCRMKNIVAIFILSLMPSTALAQSRYWERWNSDSANYDYGPLTTYVNMRSRVVASSSPRIYSFEARISEVGVSPEQEYKLLVNCTNKTTMYLSYDSTNK